MAKYFRRKIHSKRKVRAVGTGNRKKLNPIRGEMNLSILEINKEKLKDLYSIDEKELKRYVKELAKKYSGNPGIELVRKLERRMDNIIFRAGYTPTRLSAKEEIVSGAATVNGVIYDDPSHQIDQRDVVNFNGVKAKYTGNLKPWIVRENNYVTLRHIPNVHEVEKLIKEVKKLNGIDVLGVIKYYAVL